MLTLKELKTLFLYPLLAFRIGEQEVQRGLNKDIKLKSATPMKLNRNCEAGIKKKKLNQPAITQSA